MTDPDWTDPCAVAAWLKPQLFKIAAGQGTASVKHGEEMATFTQANYQGLLALYRETASECARTTGAKTGRRRAFVVR